MVLMIVILALGHYRRGDRRFKACLCYMDNLKSVREKQYEKIVKIYWYILYGDFFFSYSQERA